MKLQQFTGPVHAKGVEDTAFYRDHALVAANDVGDHPRRLGVLPAEFHDASRARLARLPFEMNATATHDSKRGKDARVLKLASPGVADFYQGTELWDLSLVDPDNRRPVDYDRRRARLDSLEPLLAAGAEGPAADQIVAFARHDASGVLVALVPRLVLPLMEDRPPRGEVWTGTSLAFPVALARGSFRHIITGERLAARPAAKPCTCPSTTCWPRFPSRCCGHKRRRVSIN